MPQPPDPDEPRLTVQLELTGDIITNFVSYSLNSEFMTPTDGWEFVVYSDENPGLLRRKFRPFQPVKIYLDEQQQIVGRIDRIQGVGDSGKSLRVEGRDYLADVCDGSVEPSLRFPKNIDIGDAVLQVLKPYGITTLFGTNLTRNLLTGKSRFSGQSAGKDFKSAKMEEFKPGDSTGNMELINKILARHSFTIQPAGRRSEAILCQPDFKSDPLYSIVRTLEGAGNVLPGATCVRDYTDVPTVSLARGRQGATGEKAASIRKEYSTFGPDAPSAIGKNPEVRRTAYSADGNTPAVIDFRWTPKNGGVEGNAGLLYRPMFYTDRESRNQSQLESGLRRMIAERLRKTLEYRCTVRGHRNLRSGALYAVDTIAQVTDEIEDVDEPLWCLSRTFRNDGSGPLTDLIFIRPESFVL